LLVDSLGGPRDCAFIMTFPEVLPAPLASALEKKGYTALTPVQLLVLEASVQGRDLRITSQTGSGKTVAIGLAVRDAVAPSTEQRKGPKVLVVTPTRELARQVEDELRWLYAELGARVTVVSGGTSYRDEHRALSTLPAVVVGTPGRLLDHINRGTFDPSSISAVVLDEADRMLDMGFREDLESIFAAMPAERRTHLVSATFPHDVERLARRIQKDPVHVEGTKLGVANADIDHIIYLVDPDQALEAIINVILSHPPGSRALVFAATRADVGDIAAALHEAGLGVASISGDLEQRERTRALAQFKSGKSPVLVATDVAARGIDVQDITLVMQVDSPNDADTYTHRSGRTGRAGKRGTSALLVPPRRLGVARRILERAKVHARIVPLPTADELRKVADQRLIEELSRPDDAEAPAPNPRVVALASRLAAIEPVERTIARLLARSNAVAGPEPREVKLIAPPAARPGARPDFAPTGRDRYGHERMNRYDRDPVMPSPRSRPRAETITPVVAPAPRSRPKATTDVAPAPRSRPKTTADAAPAPRSRPKAAAPSSRSRTTQVEAPTTAARSRPRKHTPEVEPDLSWSSEEAPRAPARKAEPAPVARATRTAPRGRDEQASYRTFRVTWGALHGADPRRLLAMLCRRGGIESSDVGSIDVGKTTSIVEIADGVADGFAESAGRRDPRDPKVAIVPDRGEAGPPERVRRIVPQGPRPGGFGPPKRGRGPAKR
jgi:ATP-dependent RNA helicase DeaD